MNNKIKYTSINNEFLQVLRSIEAKSLDKVMKLESYWFSFDLIEDEDVPDS